MIDRNRQDDLESEMKDVILLYNRAVRIHKDSVDKAMIYAMKDQPIPEELKADIENAKWDMAYYPIRLNELKKSYIKMIEAIELPSIK